MSLHHGGLCHYYSKGRSACAEMGVERDRLNRNYECLKISRTNSRSKEENYTRMEEGFNFWFYTFLYCLHLYNMYALLFIIFFWIGRTHLSKIELIILLCSWHTSIIGTIPLCFIIYLFTLLPYPYPVPSASL